uniref:Uncharacterized protein n=1 Tax=Cucumis melo TaxID=3656 RepID=A0A9I9D108_CUCME
MVIKQNNDKNKYSIFFIRKALIHVFEERDIDEDWENTSSNNRVENQWRFVRRDAAQARAEERRWRRRQRAGERQRRS